MSPLDDFLLRETRRTFLGKAVRGIGTVALAIISFYTSISGLIKAEMFPPEVRAMGVGLSYAVANAVFGGSAEYVALWFK